HPLLYKRTTIIVRRLLMRHSLPLKYFVKNSKKIDFQEVYNTRMCTVRTGVNILFIFLHVCVISHHTGVLSLDAVFNYAYSEMPNYVFEVLRVPC
ncbi:hypothetical protein L9F63_016357, partial [Diploptera punctata]